VILLASLGAVLARHEVWPRPPCNHESCLLILNAIYAVPDTLSISGRKIWEHFDPDSSLSEIVRKRQRGSERAVEYVLMQEQSMTKCVITLS
jgi:hypothetical protein